MREVYVQREELQALGQSSILFGAIHSGLRFRVLRRFLATAAAMM